MRFLKTLALTSALVVVVASASAANGSWTRIYTDNANGIFVSAISATASMTTPPVPLQYPGSRVVQAVQFVSGTGGSVSTYGSVGPIGGQTQGALNTNTSGTVLPATTASSASTITTNNSLSGVGFVISATVNALVNGRVIEIKQ